MNFINYAHRGASEYAPENTFAAFCLGIEMGANGIETDVRKTADGLLVLFHDKEVSRVTDGQGMVKDLSWETISRLDAGSWKSSKYRNERVVGFEDFLYYIGGKDLVFAIELKARDIYAEVTEKLLKFGVIEKSVITSFYFEGIENTCALKTKVRTGFLTQQITKDILEDLKRVGAYQVCPSAEFLTAEAVRQARDYGFSVRAWGIKNPDDMIKALDCGVDGMTVNFPDVLQKELERRG